MSKFASEFEFKNSIKSIAIDDKTDSGYSHTAILNKSLKSKFIRPLHSKLRARNSVSYSGKTKQYRLDNPRDFRINSFKEDQLY